MTDAASTSGAASTFGGYILLNRLPGGGVFESYVARRSGPGGERVHLQRVPAQALASQAARDAFFAEPDVRATLTHDAIAAVIDFGEADGNCFVASEHVPGLTLQQLLRRMVDARARLAPRLAVYITTQICSALDHVATRTTTRGAHFTHPSLDPEVVILGCDGRVVLRDLGNRMITLGATSGGTVVRRFVYQPPEVGRSVPVDPRSNVYTLGVCLYEMLAGTPPFFGATPLELLEAIRDRQPAPPSSVDPSLTPVDAIVARAMAKTRAERFADPRALGAALEEAAAALGTGSAAELGLHVRRHCTDCGELEVAAETTGTDEAPGDGPVTREVTVTQIPMTHEASGATPSNAADAAEPTRIAPAPVFASEAPSARSWLPVYVGTWAATALFTVLVGAAIGGTAREAEADAAVAVAGSSREASADDRAANEAPRRDAAPPSDDAAMPPEPAADHHAGDGVAGAEPDGQSEVEAEHDGASEGVHGSEAGPDVNPEDLHGGAEPASSPGGAGKRAAPVLATLRVSTAPGLTLRASGRRIRGPYRVTRPSGILTAGGKRDPFRLKIRYKLGPGGVAVTLEAEPWAMVFDDIGSGLGRTPVTLPATRAHAVELRNPSVDTRQKVSIALSK